MRIIAHRGHWKVQEEKNGRVAFERALAADYGIETDVRDHCGALAISHDVPVGEPMAFDAFLSMYQRSGRRATLALNVKADGLSKLIREALTVYAVEDYFCFDMSVPETLRYRAMGLRYFTRHSEYEIAPPLYEDAAGVWVDCFTTDWITADVILRHLDMGKEVCLVSPELHNRDHAALWSKLKSTEISRNDDLLLCTDHPDDARRYFSV